MGPNATQARGSDLKALPLSAGRASRVTPEGGNIKNCDGATRVLPTMVCVPHAHQALAADGTLVARQNGELLDAHLVLADAKSVRLAA